MSRRLTRPGQAARGSGALAAFADILVEMQPLARRPGDRRRLLRSFSRHAATPPRLAVEWTPDGTDYRGLEIAAELDFEHAWPLLHTVLDQSEKPLTRLEVLCRWPESSLPPSQQTLWRWLTRAVDESRVLRDGKGTRREPFRYELPGMVHKWQERMIADLTRRLGLESTAPAPVSSVPVFEPTPAVPPAPAADPIPVGSAASAPPAAAPPDDLRLPYPFNIMNPADVPEEVRRRAREHGGKS